MAIDHQDRSSRTEVILLEPERVPPPPPPEAEPQPAPPAPKSMPYRPPTAVPLPPMPGNNFATTPIPQPPAGPVIGNDPPAVPRPLPLPPVADPVRVGPRLATPPSALRPPYPAAKLDSGQEAALRLRLSIDERGRVTAVDAVGPADPAFLSSARRHLIAKWRYQPGTVDGRPVATSTVITLRFELEG